MSMFRCNTCGQDLLKKPCEHHPAQEQLMLELEPPRDWREEIRRYKDDP